MQRGDLKGTPLISLLRSLADDRAFGCLHIFNGEGEEALVYFKQGLVYAVSVPGRRPQLGSRLVSSGALSPEALAEALDAQRTELHGWRLGELLVHLGYVDQPVVEAFVNEQVQEAMWDLLRWRDGTWKFRRSERTREDVATPLTVEDLLAALRVRQERWEQIAAVVHGPTAVPMLSTRSEGVPAELMLDPDAWSLLCKIDGERTIAELARECGYTLFEIGQVLVSLVSAGLVDIEADAAPEQVSGLEEDPAAVMGRMASALTAEPEEESLAPVARLAEALAGDQPSPVPLQRSGPSFADSLARVSAALADVLGPQQDVADPFEVPFELRMRSRPRAAEPGERAPDPDRERRERVRAAAAAELAAAHAMAEALRAHNQQSHVAEVVDLAAVREAHAPADQRPGSAESEALAWEEHAEWLAALAAAAEDSAWDEHAEWLAALAAAVEPEAWTEYWAREAETARQAEAEAWEEHGRWLAELAAGLEGQAWDEHGQWLAELAAGAEVEAWGSHAQWLAELAASVEAEAWESHAQWLAELAASVEAEAWDEHGAREAELARQAELEAEAARQAELDAAEAQAWDEYWAREAEAARQAELEAEAARQAQAELEAAEVAAWDEYWAREAEAARQAELETEAARQAEAERRAELEAEAEVARQAQAEFEAEAEAARQAQAELEAAETEAWDEYWAREAEAARQAELAAQALRQAELEAEATRIAELAAAAAAAEPPTVLPVEPELAVPLLQPIPDLVPQQPAAWEPVLAPAARLEPEVLTEPRLEQQVLSEFSAAIASPIAPVGQDTEPVDAEPVVPTPPERAFTPPPRSELADTAALLRELSSLGGDDDDRPTPSRPAPATPPRAVTPAPKQKKRGFFGR